LTSFPFTEETIASASEPSVPVLLKYT